MNKDISEDDVKHIYQDIDNGRFNLQLEFQG
jgi:hypothetical protein